MKLSISNIAWGVEHDEQVAAMLQEETVRFVDLAPGKYFPDIPNATAADCQAVKDWWARRGISIAGMQALLFGTEGLNVFGSAESQQRLLNHLRAICRIGDGLDARRLVFGSPKNRDRTGLSDQEAMDQACAFFLRLADLADAHGVTICLEPNPEAYGCNFMTSSPETAAVVGAVNHPCIRMQLDTGSLAMNQEDPETICSTYHHLIGHIHASEPQLKPVGEGTCDHRASAEAMARHFPEAVICIEMLTVGKTDPLATIGRSVGFTKRTYLSRQ
jgi:D-psicose/D-tagatose/L-ribulose 3-epimerase